MSKYKLTPKGHFFIGFCLSVFLSPLIALFIVRTSDSALYPLFHVLNFGVSWFAAYLLWDTIEDKSELIWSEWCIFFTLCIPFMMLLFFYYEILSPFKDKVLPSLVVKEERKRKRKNEEILAEENIFETPYIENDMFSWKVGDSNDKG